MNIDDVTIDSIPEGSRLVAIFKQQAELMSEYWKIETSFGLHVPLHPYNIDDGKVQHRIKDMFWRATEELCEALEVFYQLPTIDSMLEWRKQWDSAPQLRHFFEELIDAFHFIVEASTVAGHCPVDDEQWKIISGCISLPQEPPCSYEYKIYEIIYTMGIAANCLKNKPWKQTQMQTDKTHFQNCMHAVLQQFLALWAYLNANIDDLYLLYHKKASVNTFRQRSRY